MKATEAAALLTIAAAYDNRKPDADQAKAWAMALDGLRFEDCREIVVAHYRRSRDWLMPVDVVTGVRALRSRRVMEHPPVQPPAWLDPDDTGAYCEWERKVHRAIADGAYVAEEPAAELAPRDVGSLGQIGRRVPRVTTHPERVPGGRAEQTKATSADCAGAELNTEHEEGGNG